MIALLLSLLTRLIAHSFFGGMMAGLADKEDVLRHKVKVH
jgi:hypothetical protein